MTSNSVNSLLLFGDYGTEVIRLSQLYDPENARYQRLPDGAKPTKIKTSTGTLVTRKVYLPEQRQRTLFFNEVASPSTGPTGAYNVSYWIDTWDQLTDAEIAEKEATSEEGNYVPVPQTLVVVDTATQRWGQYTLLVVDRVETEGEDGKAPSYQSTLVPINFSGGIDDASRAIDYDNNTMMLYVEDINLGSGKTVQRLIPDRKLMMYGQKSMRYVIRKTISGINTVICTNSYATQHADATEYIDYVSAAGSINGALIQITNVDTFKSLSGKRVVWFDADGNRQDRTVELQLNLDGTLVDGSDCSNLFKELSAVYDRGGNVVVIADAGDSLNNVQIPGVSYLRKTLPALVAGEIVEFMVYEMTTDDNGLTFDNRLVFASKLTVRSGSSLSSMDVTDAVITGFDVRLGDDDVTDIWEIPQGSTYDDANALKVKLPDETYITLNPYLQLDDGGEEKIVSISGTNKAFYSYGMEQLNGANKGTEFDIVFKYFPPKKLGVKSNSTIDARYSVVNSARPSSLKVYYIKDEDDNFVLASNNGHPPSFASGTTYYEICPKMSWDIAVSRPNTEMLICRKRVRVTEGASNAIRKISLIPVWNNTNYVYSFAFLVYKEDFTRPHLITTDPSDYGSVKMSGSIAKVFPKYRDGSRDDTIYNADLTYNSSSTGKAESTSANTKSVSFRLQNWTIESIGVQKWQIMDGSTATFPINDNGTVHAPYGTHNLSAGIRRPYLLCRMETDTQTRKQYGVYHIPIGENGFPNNSVTSTDIKENNQFLKEFYFRALSDNDLWATEADATSGETKYPTHFVVRSVTEDGVETRPMPITTNDTVSGKQAFSADFYCDGLPTPSEDCYAIVVVEFLYWNGADYERLYGVPVEVRPES